jgi:hypothetical protein
MPKPAIDGDAAVALAFRRVEVGVIVVHHRQVQRQLFLPHLGLLQAEDVGAFHREPGGEPLALQGPQAVDVPGENARSFHDMPAIFTL